MGKLADRQLLKLLEILRGFLVLQYVVIGGYSCEDRRRLWEEINQTLKLSAH